MTPVRPKHSPLIGAHTSTAKGVHQALLEGQRIGANTIQIFTSNQKQWKGRTFTEKELALWKETREKTGITKIMSHGSYLINPGSNKPDLLEKSRHALAREVERCSLLDLSFLNIHPGAATGDSAENCMERICETLLGLESLLEKGSMRILLETTAGQGTCIGHRFEQIGYLVNAVHSKIPIGVCLDTCHVFAAGYDIRNESAWNTTLQEFEEKIGLSYLYALHLNDSIHSLGSRKDRHASIGKGEIGSRSFEIAMQDKRLDIPKYLETPFGDTMWTKEIAWLKQCALTGKKISSN